MAAYEDPLACCLTHLDRHKLVGIFIMAHIRISWTRSGSSHFVQIHPYPSYLPEREGRNCMGLEWTGLDSGSALVIYTLGHLGQII